MLVLGLMLKYVAKENTFILSYTILCLPGGIKRELLLNSIGMTLIALFEKRPHLLYTKYTIAILTDK